MPRTTFTDHPLHPQLVNMPLALLPTSLVLDLLRLRSGQQRHADAAFYTLVGGMLGGMGAAATGIADYLSIRTGSQAKRVANLHGGLNLGIIGLVAASVALRLRDRGSRGAVLLSATANAISFASAWYGGHLVYEHGMRVRGVDPTADQPTVRLPGDQRLAEPFHQLSERSPAVGPGPSGDGVGRPVEAPPLEWPVPAAS